MHFSLVERLPDHRTARSPEAANERLPRVVQRVFYCTETVRSVSHVMSTLSPTFTFSRMVGSTTRRLYFHPFGPTKLTDEVFLSIALMVAVIVLCAAALPPGCVDCPILEPWTSAATGASPGGFNLAVTVLLYVIVTLSPTLSSSKRFAVFGTSIVSNYPSAVLRCTIRWF